MLAHGSLMGAAASPTLTRVGGPCPDWFAVARFRRADRVLPVAGEAEFGSGLLGDGAFLVSRYDADGDGGSDG
ncbi:hypothetical protein Raf01_82520 [Rugosimonospora africana]|uniref:Uncharacterized protein n=1 Tax=Rugosimonospora africana TaxID=556532 RepID=A0A8J3VVA6_9ACTN|nr:hypothetical protein Raf01_82520 [Rugosimonospora africana]